MLANKQHHGGHRQKNVSGRENPKPESRLRVVRIAGVMHASDKKAGAVAEGQDTLESIKDKKRFERRASRD